MRYLSPYTLWIKHWATAGSEGTTHNTSKSENMKILGDRAEYATVKKAPYPYLSNMDETRVGFL